MDRMSSLEDSQIEKNEAARPAPFEETYPRYEFAEMVRIGLVLAEWFAAGAGWLAKVGRRVQRPYSGRASRPSPGEMRAAE
jgi:hypothetical protein